MAAKVTEVRFELVADGKRKILVFLTPEKIEQLLADQGPLGGFLGEMRDSAATLKARDCDWSTTHADGDR